MSTGSVNAPEASILSFSNTCGSGTKGARPRVRLSTINKDSGILLKILRIVDINTGNGGSIRPDHDGDYPAAAT